MLTIFLTSFGLSFDELFARIPRDILVLSLRFVTLTMLIAVDVNEKSFLFIEFVQKKMRQESSFSN